MIYPIARQIHRLRDTQKRRTVLSTIAEFNDSIDRLEELEALDRARFARELAKIRLYLDPPKTSVDPTSRDYFQRQLDIYKQIAQREEYSSVVCESSKMAPEQALTHSAPHAFEAPGSVANYLNQVAHAIKHIPWQKGATILDIGPGWGHTTFNLAQMGFKVTAVELDAAMCARLTRLKESGILNLQVQQADMLEHCKQCETESIDGAFFFQSFHHCFWYIDLLKQLKRILKPGGSIVFASEPINLFPQPWGLRLDGESLWVARRYGWMELGFNFYFFRRLLTSLGFMVKRHRNYMKKHCNVIIAVKA